LNLAASFTGNGCPAAVLATVPPGPIGYQVVVSLPAGCWPDVVCSIEKIGTLENFGLGGCPLRLDNLNPVNDVCNGAAGDERVPTWALVAGVSAVPVVVLGLASALIVTMKLLRRQRRRSTGDPVQRIVAGWDELLDHAHDGGVPLPDVATRRERCAFLGGSATVTALADRADRAVFAPGATDPGDVDRHWADVMQARNELSLSFGRRGRLRAAVNIASLRKR